MQIIIFTLTCELDFAKKNSCVYLTCRLNFLVFSFNFFYSNHYSYATLYDQTLHLFFQFFATFLA